MSQGEKKKEEKKKQKVKGKKQEKKKNYGRIKQVEKKKKLKANFESLMLLRLHIYRLLCFILSGN